MKVGVIGTGRIGLVHIQGLRALPSSYGIEISAVADAFMSDELSTRLKKEYGIPYTSTHAEELLEDSNIQAVFICSPTDTHSYYSLKALAQGKHVFCEKPIDMDLTKIEEVAEAIKSANVIYQVGFNRRFDHQFRSAQKAIASGRIGTPQMLRIISRDPSPPPIEYVKTSGGIFMDMMIHDFDMARFQSSSEVEEIYACGAVLVDNAIGEAGDSDSAIVSLRFRNGILGSIENCRQAVYGYDQRVEMLGSKGAVQVENVPQSTMKLSDDTGITGDNPVWFFLERYMNAYKEEQQSFFQSIEGKHEVECSVLDGYEAARIAYAARKSSSEKRLVHMEEIPKHI